MGYCITCNEWCGYSTSTCENKNCEIIRKLIGLYGVNKVGDCLSKVFIRDEKAVDNRTTNIDKITSKEETVTRYNLRTTKDKE